MKRGEKELVDMVQEAIDDGKKVEVFPITRSYVNVNTEEDLELAKQLIKKNNPRVLIIHPQMKYFGGAELLIAELANWLTKRGIKNDILTSSKSKQIEDSLINTEVFLIKTGMDLSPPAFKSIKDILKFIRIYRKKIRGYLKNYDVINFHNFPVTWTLWPRKKPTVWMLNEPPSLWSKPEAGFVLKSLNKIRCLMDKKIVRSIDVICVADEFNRNRAKERYGRDSRVVYYGVNYDFFSKGNSRKAINKYNLKNKFVVVQSGMLTEVKNQLESVKTIEKLKKNIPNILLILAGTWDEDCKKRIDDYIKNNKLEKHVLFTGNLNREELRDLYKATNLGLFPIGKQGGWLAPFEVLCSAKPIIVSEELGAASIIKKFDLGVVTNDYETALLEIYNNQKQYKKQAKKASLFVKKNLSWKIFTDKMIKAYKDALKMH